MPPINVTYVTEFLAIVHVTKILTTVHVTQVFFLLQNPDCPRERALRRLKQLQSHSHSHPKLNAMKIKKEVKEKQKIVTGLL